MTPTPANVTRAVTTFISLCLTVLAVRGSNHFAGMVASNSVGGSSNYVCRTQQQWNELANTAKNNGFQSIRITGFDCDALNMASSATEAAGLSVLAGMYFSGSVASNAASIDADVQTFRAAHAKYGASRYKGLTVGNEATDTASAVIAKVNDIRKYLRSVGVGTPVSTVHTRVAIRDNPVLCSGDFVGANAHAFYDGSFSASQTGDFVFQTVVPALTTACPSKTIMITESGWPSRGSVKGVGIPSVANERSALLNLNCACRSNPSVLVYAFEADDQLWKGSDNERSFGIVGKLILNGDVLAPC